MLARVCLWVQALTVLVSLTMLVQYVWPGPGELTGLALIVLAGQTAAVLGLSALSVMTTRRRTWVRPSAIGLQALIALGGLGVMFLERGFFWGALALLAAGVGATQLLTEPAQRWFDVRGPRGETMSRSSAEEKPAVEEDRHARAARDEMWRDRVIRPAYATAGRHLIGLTVPALLVFLPLGLLTASVLFFLVDGSAAVVNGGFQLIAPPGEPVLTWSVATLVASVAGQAVVLPATVVLAAGRMVGKNVSASAAMRAAARRWPAMTALVLIGMVVVAAFAAIGFGVLAWTEALVVAFAVMAALALGGMPCLLAVAGVVLEGRSARGALARAYQLTGGSPWTTVLTLAFGVVLVPALVTQVASSAAAGSPVAQAGVGSVLALVSVPFQAAVIARLFLHRLAVKGTTAEFEQVVANLPAGAPRPVRPVPVLAGLLLPSLLYGAAVLVNPLGWLEVSETVVTRERPRDPGSDAAGRSKPTLESSDLRALHAGQDGRMVMLMDDSREAKLLTCADSTCSDNRLGWAEPVAVDSERRAVSARLTDGRLAVTTWAVDEHYRWVYDENWRARLGLLLCDATACVPAPGGRTLAEATWGGRNTVVALAARPGGGLLVAQLHGIPEEDSDADKEVLSLTFCDDPACARPRVTEVAQVPVNTDTGGGRDLIVGVDPDDRPVALRVDHDSGAIFVVTCAEPACARAYVEQVVEGDAFRHWFDGRERPQTAMVVRADGRPMIAYRDIAGGTIMLLDCRTRTCSQADTALLTAPGERHAGPAMVLDRAGRALVAFQDLEREQVVVAACTGTLCTRTPVTTIPRGGGHGLAMALDDRGRPMIVWTDFASEDDWDLVVTTPLTLR
ncbi:hypothetical protein C1J01_36795 [Nonomuraea aridisoli]|uniref:Uncharacterized protein n=2 Tax=Nonomuraea aridisoli TaxID=2070368 RepID=A0A2W2DDJ3_9ACTN|nr:hypothetical protein C1J01_36795 [Nonomuraea aridisoli]